MDIGDIGIWTSYRPFGHERAGEAAKVAEEFGYGTWWVGGSPHVPDIRPILEATSTLVAATGILNVWSNDPGDTAVAAAVLRADFPGRFMLGVGIGHPEATSSYRRPLETMREFLDGLDASPSPPPVDERCLAALGPKMLDLAGERTAGTHPYFTTVDHTRFARDRSVLASSWLPRWRASSTPTRCAPRPLPATTRRCPSACATTRRTSSTSASPRTTLPMAAPTGSSTRSSPRAARSRSARSCARTSTRAPITSAFSRWARTASHGSPGPRSLTP
jgi:hypothetical protein